MAFRPSKTVCIARAAAWLDAAFEDRRVGRKTASQELGTEVDFIPPDFVADSLIEHFPVSGWGLNMLLPRVQSGGRTVLADAFGEAGVRVVEVAAYESRCPDGMPEATAAALSAGDVDAIAFSSGKTAQHTAQQLGGVTNCWVSS